MALRLTTAAVLVLALAPGAAAADPIIAEAPGRVATDLRNDILGMGVSTSPDIADYGSMARVVVIYIAGKPFLFSEDDIDRIVASPWSLNDSTRAKLEALPPRMRFQLYSSLAAHMGNVRFVPATGLPGSVSGGIRPLRVDFDDATKNDTLNDLGRSLETYFRPEELVDLAVWGLSTQPFFPKTEAGWSKLKTKLVHYDLTLGLLGLAAFGAANEGRLDLGGWFYKTPQDNFRLGWYASGYKLGFEWHPYFATGLQAGMPGFDAALGWVEHLNARKPEEVRAVELIVREHLLSLLSRGTPWELSALARVHFSIDHTDPAQRGLRADLVFYARRPTLFEHPDLDFLAQGILGSDFKCNHSADVSVGLENKEREVAGALRLMTAASDLAPFDFRIGVVLGGATGAVADTDYYRDVEDAGRRLRGAIRYARSIEARACSLRRAGTGSEDELRQAAIWLGEARSRLKPLMEKYQEMRARCRAARTRLIGPLTVEEAAAAELLPGPISAEDARFAQERLAGLEDEERALALQCSAAGGASPF